jgi:hypothetical protein
VANIAAIRSVGASLVAYLDLAYRNARFPTDVSQPACSFTVMPIGGVRSTDVSTPDRSVAVVIFLYRASINHHLRNVGSMAAPGARPVPLSVDLHYLFTFWSSSADNEQLVLAWTMRQLHTVPVLDSSVLGGEAAWAPEDVVQLIPEEITTEDMMRIWDSIEPPYHLSLSYIARVVRIDPDEARDQPPVVATRFNYAVPVSRP